MVIKYLLVSAIFILFGYCVFRIIVKNEYRKNFKLSPFSYVLELAVFAVHANLIYLFIPAQWPDLPSLPNNPILNTLSIIVFAFGLIILLIAWFELGTGTSFGQDKHTLNTSGMYRYSRNPQLVGYGMLLLGFVIAYFSWYAVGWFLQYLVIAYFMIKSEEEFLFTQYGEEYEQYCKDVPRIVRLF